MPRDPCLGCSPAYLAVGWVSPGHGATGQIGPSSFFLFRIWCLSGGKTTLTVSSFKGRAQNKESTSWLLWSSRQAWVWSSWGLELRSPLILWFQSFPANPVSAFLTFLPWSDSPPLPDTPWYSISISHFGHFPEYPVFIHSSDFFVIASLWLQRTEAWSVFCYHPWLEHNSAWHIGIKTAVSCFFLKHLPCAYRIGEGD